MWTKLSIAAALAASTTLGLAAQHTGDQMPGQTPASAEAVAACVQAQQQTGRISDRAQARLEAARQTNNPADMRAAIDDLQAALGEIRAQASSCADLATTAAPGSSAGHQMTTTEEGPTVPRGTPIMQHGSAPTTPAAPGAQRSHSVTQPTGAADHSKMGQPKPGEKPTTPKPTKAAPSSGEAGSAKHAGMEKAQPKLPVLPAKTSAVDPVCKMNVDSTTAPKATYKGETYYFCSEADKKKFLKDPARYIKKAPR